MTTSRHQLLEAIAHSTGIHRRLLERIKLSMDQRAYFPMLQTFLVRGLVPSSSEILLRLFLNPRTGQARVEPDPARLYSEYHVMVQSSQGKLRIAARMNVFGRRGFFRRAFHGRITIRYQLEVQGQTIEYRQDFLLKGPSSMKVRQVGYQKPLPENSGQLVQRLIQPASLPLLSPARAIYL